MTMRFSERLRRKSFVMFGSQAHCRLIQHHPHSGIKEMSLMSLIHRMVVMGCGGLETQFKLLYSPTVEIILLSL